MSAKDVLPLNHPKCSALITPGAYSCFPYIVHFVGLLINKIIQIVPLPNIILSPPPLPAESVVSTESA